MKEEGLDTQQSSSKVKKPKSSKSLDSSQKGNPPLPLWVEILFVQIGLPDKWLRFFLKLKRDGKRTIHQRKNYIAYTALIVTPLLYVSPIIIESHTSNTCVKEAGEYLRNNKGEKYSNTAWAMRFCNGGDIK